jgi:hypothetical protein
VGVVGTVGVVFPLGVTTGFAAPPVVGCVGVVGLLPSNLSIKALLATPAAPPSTVEVIPPDVVGLVGVTDGLFPVDEIGATAGLVFVEVAGVVGLVVVEVIGATGVVTAGFVPMPVVLTAGDAGRITEDTAGLVVTVTGLFPGDVTTRGRAAPRITELIVLTGVRFSMGLRRAIFIPVSVSAR